MVTSETPEIRIGERIEVCGEFAYADTLTQRDSAGELLHVDFTISRRNPMTDCLWVKFDHAELCCLQTETVEVQGLIEYVRTEREWTTFRLLPRFKGGCHANA